MPEMDVTLWGLFLSAFLSSTLLPGGSEWLLAWLSSQQQYNPLTILGLATLGNTLGGMSSWLLGRVIAVWYPARRLNKPQHQRALERIQGYGAPVLLLSWLPVVGDPLCMAAGWLRIHWLLALLYIALGKALRYAVLMFVVG